MSSRLLADFAQRHERIVSVSPPSKARRRAKRAAQELTRVGYALRASEQANEAMSAFLSLLYAYDRAAEDWPNIDAKTGVILIPTPFSSRSYRKWGLRRTESAVLRLHLVELEAAARRGEGEAPAVLYDGLINKWLINLGDYPSRRAAMAWIKRHELTAKRYRELSKALQKGSKSASKP